MQFFLSRLACMLRPLPGWSKPCRTGCMQSLAEAQHTVLATEAIPRQTRLVKIAAGPVGTACTRDGFWLSRWHPAALLFAPRAKGQVVHARAH